MNELLNCPFCGGEAYVHEHYSFPGYERKGLYPNYEPIGYAVGCVTADCRGKRENTGFMYSTEDEAIAAWNKRDTMSCKPNPMLVWDYKGNLLITLGGLKTWDVTDKAKAWFKKFGDASWAVMRDD